MAAVANSETVNIVVNDVELQVPKGELIVESVKRLGLEIPIFCYHPRMKPVGMCRMCLVEVGFKQPDGSVRKMPKPQAGCTLPASEGMVIYTDSEMVHRDRKGVLEFLLVNHPLDCPICDRGGECPLQNNTMFYGPSTSRFIEMKRHSPKAFPLSQYVTLDLERCIQCGRCVRFTEEISGDSQLAFRFRGAQMQPSTFKLMNFDSKFSGNVIEICPVGALTSSKYRFRARPWDIETKPSICLECGNGCNIWLDHRSNKFVRVNGRTNESINEEWTCDRGKFGHDWLNSENRLRKVVVRDGATFRDGTWTEAYQSIMASFSSGPCAVLVSETVSNEGLYMLQKLFRRGFECENIDHRWTKTLRPIETSAPPTKIADIEQAASILVFGTSLADTQPITYLRVRKAALNSGTAVVVASDAPTDVDAFAKIVLRYRPGTADELAKGLERAMRVIKNLSLDGFEQSTAAHTERFTGVVAADLEAAANLIANAPVMISSASLYDTSSAAQTVSSLQSIAVATAGALNIYSENGNDQGAMMLGVTPGSGGKNTHEILRAAALGQIKSLWLVGDPLKTHPNSKLVQEAMENVDFLVVQSTLKSDACSYASVILPMDAPVEQEGSYTNMEGRCQYAAAALAVSGDSKPAWRVYGEMLMRIRGGKPMFNAREVLAEIAAEVPSFDVPEADVALGRSQTLKPANDEVYA